MRLFILLLGVVFSGNVFAESALRVSPTRIHIDNNQRTTVVNLYNGSGITKAYRISFETRYMNAEGGTFLVEDSPFSAAEHLVASPRRIIIRDGERQTLRLQFRKKPEMADGDYFAHMKFTQVPVPQKVEAPAAEGKATFKVESMVNVSVPVSVSVGDIASELEITNVEKLNDKYLLVTVKRSGNGQIQSYINAFIGDAHVVRSSLVAIYRNIDEAHIKVPLATAYETISGKEIVLNINQNKSPKSDVLASYKRILP